MSAVARISLLSCVCLVGSSLVAGCGSHPGSIVRDAISGGVTQDLRHYAQSGGDISSASIDGLTPLMYAMQCNALEIYEELLMLGANPDVPTSDGRTILAWAAMKKEDTSWLRLALENQADPNKLSTSRASRFSHPPIRFATTGGTLAHTDLLIRHGADIDYYDEAEQRPLVFAMGVGRYDVAMLLLESGANYRADDTKPHSFLDEIHRVRDDKENLLVVRELRRQFEEIEDWLRHKGVAL